MSVHQHKEMGSSRSNNGEEYAEKGAPKRRSPVWNHFTLNEVTKRAICNHCKEDLQGDSKQGTNHLKRHLEKKHPDEYARTDFQSSIKNITAAFRREELVLSVERNTEPVASHSADKKRASLFGEEREDDHLVEKRARLNKEKQLKRPISESGLNVGGAILIGEKNNMPVQLPVQLGLQNRNGSTLELGKPLELFDAEHLQLIEKNQKQESQIKQLKEALNRAKEDTREEKKARVAAEQEVIGWKYYVLGGVSLWRKQLHISSEHKCLGKHKCLCSVLE